MVKFYWVTELLKANQIDIPDYQQWVGCNTKRLVRQILLEKVRISNGNIDILLIIFSKIVKCYRVKDWFKKKQIDFPDY